MARGAGPAPRPVSRYLRRFGGRELDTAGDGFFAAFPKPADAIRCACRIVEDVQQLGIDIRAALALGPLGNLWVANRDDGTLWKITTSNNVLRVVPLQGVPISVISSESAVWVAVARGDGSATPSQD